MRSRASTNRRNGICLRWVSFSLICAVMSMPALGETTRVSVDSLGNEGNNLSWRSTISADGRFVAFESRADNLVANDTNQLADLFLHDRDTGVTTRVNVDSSGNQTNTDQSFGFAPSLSADGRYVTFSTRAPDVVPSDTNGPLGSDVFVHDTQTGETTRVSVDSLGGQGNSESSGGSLSGDGQLVAFQSRASNLVANDTNAASDVFVHDRQSGATTRVSTNTGGEQANGASFAASISGNGQFVAFASFATNLVANDNNGQVDIFVHDLQTGTTTRVSVDSNGLEANGQNAEPVMSNDGRFVAFESRANNLDPDDLNTFSDIYVHDQQTGVTSVVSKTEHGNSSGFITSSTEPTISADGTIVAFTTGTRLVPEDTDNIIEVYVHNLATGELVRAGVDSLGNSGNSSSQRPGLSADGTILAFDSSATNLVASDTNETADVFVNDSIESPEPPEPAEPIHIRCIHTPLYPQPGEEVNIIAESVNDRAVRTAADVVEIFVGDLSTPVASAPNQPGASHTFTPSGPLFGYGCRASQDTQSGPKTVQTWNSDELLRTVPVGDSAIPVPAYNAVPIILNGPPANRIDIVFFADDTDYTSPTDPVLANDLFDLIYEGYFTISWFIDFQYMFNFWIATDMTANGNLDPSDTRGLCSRDEPNRFKKRWAYADAAGIVHRDVCRDNAGSPGTFTIEVDAGRLQVLAHETGHRPFGLADEYCCDGGYFSSKSPVFSNDYNPPFPNLYKTEDRCRDDAINRIFSADDCRLLRDEDGKDWWIGEADYTGNGTIPRVDRVWDLMQQTGDVRDAAGNFLDRYAAGPSELERLSWFISQCLNGEC